MGMQTRRGLGKLCTLVGMSVLVGALLVQFGTAATDRRLSVAILVVVPCGLALVVIGQILLGARSMGRVVTAPLALGLAVGRVVFGLLVWLRDRLYSTETDRQRASREWVPSDEELQQSDDTSE